MIRRQASVVAFVAAVAMFTGTVEFAMGETIKLKLQSLKVQTPDGGFTRVTQNEEWNTSQTAIIVCDVWDYHHCLNAVRRLEEFAPRLDQVLKSARTRGAIVIHAPSDCMPAYTDHPARQRAMQAPKAKNTPSDVEHWCSRLKTENQPYPIDQSDGGEDDDPAEHAEWAAKLKALGRNPGTPWKKQSDLIAIDADRDYISDRGDEVWNILEQRGIRNVILTGVHCNMCVLGRPFGLRQMVRNGKHVAFMRDMSDSMYSPKSYPFVDHFTGHDLVVEYVERNICPTITSDQFLGDQPFRWKGDQRRLTDLSKPLGGAVNPAMHWTSVRFISRFADGTDDPSGPVWYRGALRIPAKWPVDGPASLSLPAAGKYQVWLNGHELQPSPPSSDAAGQARFSLASEHAAINDYNLIVVKTAQGSEYVKTLLPMHVFVGSHRWAIERHDWQVRVGDDPKFSNIPLPAKFGIGPDAVLRLKDFPDPF